MDPRFAEDEPRRGNRPIFIELHNEVFETRTSEEWMGIFIDKGLMFCPVQHAAEIQNDPQALANRYMVDFQDPYLGTLHIPGYPIHFSANTAGTHSLAPSLGQHTTEILQELGYSSQEIELLKRDSVIR